MTSLQSQYMLCPPLACSTARTHQQPKIGTSGYFTWETGPWHQISQVSNEYRRRQSETVSVKTAYAPTRRPYFGAELRRRHRLARVRCCNRVRVGKPAKLEERLVQRWIKIHVEDKRWLYTCLQRRNARFARNYVLEVDNLGGGSVMMWGAISYA
jgi:hypothetical protein